MANTTLGVTKCWTSAYRFQVSTGFSKWSDKVCTCMVAAFMFYSWKEEQAHRSELAGCSLTQGENHSFWSSSQVFPLLEHMAAV